MRIRVWWKNMPLFGGFREGKTERESGGVADEWGAMVRVSSMQELKRM